MWIRGQSLQEDLTSSDNVGLPPDLSGEKEGTSGHSATFCPQLLLTQAPSSVPWVPSSAGSQLWMDKPAPFLVPQGLLP